MIANCEEITLLDSQTTYAVLYYHTCANVVHV